MSDPRSSILADKQMREGLLYALDSIDDSLGRPEVGQLRDVLRVLVDPYDPKSKAFMEFIWDEQRRNKEEAA